MADKIIRLNEGYPITHEDAVLDNNGVTIGSKVKQLQNDVAAKVIEADKVQQILEDIKGSGDVPAATVAQVAVNTGKLSELEGRVDDVDKQINGNIKPSEAIITFNSGPTSAGTRIKNDLVEGETYHVEYSTTSGWCMFSFIKNETDTWNSTGALQILVVNTSSERDFVAPSATDYPYIYMARGNASSSVVISTLEVKENGLIDDIREMDADLRSEIGKKMDIPVSDVFVLHEHIVPLADGSISYFLNLQKNDFDATILVKSDNGEKRALTAIFKDDSGDEIERITIQTNVERYDHIPAGTTQIQFYNGATLFSGVTLELSIRSYAIDRDFSPMKVVCFGDSITDGGDTSYVNSANRLGSAEYVNCGFGGTRMTNIQGSAFANLVGFFKLCEAVSSGDYTDVDEAVRLSGNEGVDENGKPTAYAIHAENLKSMDWSKVCAISIFYGANDWAGNIQIGTLGEKNTRTYIGACEYGLDLLLSKYPHLQVLFIAPIYREMTLGDASTSCDTEGVRILTMSKYVEAIHTLAEKYHAPVLEFSGINHHTLPYYSLDGTHPNRRIGMDRMGYQLVKAVETYLAPYNE